MGMIWSIFLWYQVALTKWFRNGEPHGYYLMVFIYNLTIFSQLISIFKFANKRIRVQ